MTKTEKRFCEYLAITQNAVSAAKLSGFTDEPEIAAARLIQKTSVRKRCKKIIKSLCDSTDAVGGLYRIAFSQPVDIINKVFSEQPDFSKSDLFCVSEIKKGANGAVEIKFFDKLKALQLISEMRPNDEANKLKDFYEAITLGAKSISENRNDEE